MASGPKKDTASETALRAVEDALNIDFTEDETPAQAAETSGNVSDTDPDFMELEQRLADAANDLRRQSGEPDPGMAPPPRLQPRRPRRGERPPVPQQGTPRGERPRADRSELAPANDDRTGLGDVAFAFHRPPSSRIYWIAAVFSLV
ncbi:MAG: hypothetical protein VYD64_08320, partial [Pseudomonadota bacterium]|nr:hypothetical protein [Pseudomonadota bacterium]